MNRSRYSVRSLILLMAVVFATSMVSAQTAGYDLLQTSSGASIDLSSLGLGVVNLKGVPIQSSTGNTDTIMHRTADMPSGGERSCECYCPLHSEVKGWVAGRGRRLTQWRKILEGPGTA